MLSSPKARITRMLEASEIAGICQKVNHLSYQITDLLQIYSHIAALQSMLLRLGFLEELQFHLQLSSKELCILQQKASVLTSATDQKFYALTKAALHSANKSDKFSHSSNLESHSLIP